MNNPLLSFRRGCGNMAATPATKTVRATLPVPISYEPVTTPPLAYPGG